MTNLTESVNLYQRAPSSKIVCASYVATIRVPIIENGHTRSHPASVDSTELSPLFRVGKSAELPVEVKSSAISGDPSSEPIADPTG